MSATRVDVAFVLDTTGSMSGLIEGAKLKIWSIVEAILAGDPPPTVRVGLVGYRDKGDVYVTKVFDLNADMDKVYQDLRSFKANGGGDRPEHVSRALCEAVTQVKWSSDKETLRMIFLVGDSPPHEDYDDGFDHRTAVKQAAEKDISVHTIQCGSDADTRKVWQEIARAGKGEYAAIEQSGGMSRVPTPYDDELGAVSRKLGETSVAYGHVRMGGVYGSRSSGGRKVVVAYGGGEKPVAVSPEEAALEEKKKRELLDHADAETVAGRAGYAAAVVKATPDGAGAISDIPLGGTSVVGVSGVGGGGLAGCLGFRDGGGRDKCVVRFGGSAASESCVESALAWLSAHQGADGSWKASECALGDVGLTGLATLAYLGAGHTHKEGPRAPAVKRALEWLCSKQKPGGALADGEEVCGEAHAIAALAITEAYGMTADEKLREPAQRALDYSTGKHRVPKSGWGRRPAGEADLETTAWFLMQVRSAKVAGLKVEAEALAEPLGFVIRLTDEKGLARRDEKAGPTLDMAAAALAVRLLTGSGKDDAATRAGAGQLLAGLSAKGSGGGGDPSYLHWYWGQLAMFPRAPSLPLDRLVKAQSGEGEARGSWAPGGAERNRAEATALAAMTLETYYRYLPMYGGSASVMGVSESDSALGFGEWDLVAAVESGRVKLEEVKEESLPEDMKKLSADERKAYIDGRIAERKKLRDKLAELAKARDEFLRKEAAAGKSKPDAFDKVILEMLRSRAGEKGIKYGAGK
jgi:hypothetical protein